MGRWFLHPYETVLVGVKGRIDDLMAPIKNNAQSALIVEPKPDLASQKPDVMYSRIKEHWRAPFFLEMYARWPQCY